MLSPVNPFLISEFGGGQLLLAMRLPKRTTNYFSLWGPGFLAHFKIEVTVWRGLRVSNDVGSVGDNIGDYSI